MATDSALSVESAMQLRFPPFPQAPDGVELIPFHLFRPSGIRVPIDDDDDEYQRAPGVEIERDGLGILTIPLRVKHVMDTQEKKKKRKKKVNGAPQVQVAPEKPKTWWEVWEELEEIRRNAYDASVTVPPPSLRSAFRALNDVIGIWLPWIASIRRVSTSKTVVPGQRLRRAYSTCGISYANQPRQITGCLTVFQFRIYIGLLQQTLAPLKDATPDGDPVSDDTDSDSGDTDDVLDSGKDASNRMEAFINDPELSMKVFFSSHFRERGLIW